MRLSAVQREFLQAAVAAGGDVGRPELTTSGRRLDWFVAGQAGSKRVSLRHDSGVLLQSRGLIEPVMIPGRVATARLAGSRAYHFRVTAAGREALAGKKAQAMTDEQKVAALRDALVRIRAAKPGAAVVGITTEALRSVGLLDAVLAEERLAEIDAINAERDAAEIEGD